jgi:hypothetical protein
MLLASAPSISCVGVTEDQPSEAANVAAPLKLADQPKEFPAICNRPASSPLIDLVWDALQGDSHVKSMALGGTKGSIPATIENETTDPVLVTLKVAVEANGSRIERYLGQVDLRPNESASIALDLAELGIDPEALQYSASAKLSAHFTTGSGRMGTAFSKTVYFHAEKGDLALYDQQVLESTFASGNIRSNEAIAVERPRGLADSTTPIVLRRITMAVIARPEEFAKSRLDEHPRSGDF